MQPQTDSRDGPSEGDTPVASDGLRTYDLDGPAHPSGASGSDPTHWRSGGTLLVVDDNPAVLEVMRLLLERCGFTILTAADGQSALDIFRRRADEIRLALLDLKLPDIDGEAVFHAMRQIRPDIRAILCSGHLTDEAADRMSMAGWAAVIRKPFRIIPFLQTVRNVLEG